ncbi:MAG: SH3 domain-containing protein [Clostridiales bacterium]|nr:SH3 domain-containing protein [Clostridiales bacterium]
MKRIDWKVFLLLGIIISVAVGFLYGTGILGGSSPSAGSREDPLASASYADSAINQKVQEMDTRIRTLEARIQSLESELSVFTGEPIGQEPADGSGASGSGGASTPPAGSGSGSGGGGSAESGSASQANIGKTASVKSDVVNLRESASTSSNILKKLTPTDTFTITKADKDWYQVQLGDGTVGWVFWNLVVVR